ncbi:MAG: glycosyltransferase [Alphaproteobacteria bacterium]|nr:MAG: glycosyltransferase [Alphaproteobacteria bacterium]
MRRRHLVIFLKAPQVGRVKTRLAAQIGRVRAARIARRLSEWAVRRLARDRRWRTTLAVSPDHFAAAGRWWPAGVPRISQGGGDLGARMRRPLVTLSPGPVVIVGGDIPDLTPALIEQAFRLLGHHDVVFGPAADGGYWLIGFARRRPLGQPFHAVRWSSRHALADTLRNLRSGLRVAWLPQLHDVDRVEDLDAVRLPVSAL